VASVQFDGVSKVYDNGFRAVDDLHLDIQDGEFMVLVGPSGCGKTTALRMLAGLEDISEGDLVIDDEVVNRVPPQKRDIAMVFQNYALYPHLSVYDNMAYGLKIQKLGKREIDRRVHEIARVIGLEDLLGRKPKALSGGQRQRVAMGRAIVRQPKVFLMDEPLSNLDAKLRVQMRSEVARIQHELKATTVYVTHDQVEAMTMGDRVALMRRGVLQQVDEPMRLYTAPANLFVASFIGSPAMNLLDARLRAAETTSSRRSVTRACGWPRRRSRSPGSSSSTSAGTSPSACGPSTSRTPRSRPTCRAISGCGRSSTRWRHSGRSSSCTLRCPAGRCSRTRSRRSPPISTTAPSRRSRPRSAMRRCRSWAASTSCRARGRAGR